MSELWRLGIGEAADGLMRGDFTASELLDATLARISAVQPRLNVYIALRDGQARDEARAADARIARGAALGPLDGIPIALKGNIAIAGLANTAGIPGRRSAMATDNAYCVERLRRAGAIAVGTLNLHEAALGATTDNFAFGRTGNPHDPLRTPGGSSGGAGAAVAAFACFGALGTDTMGSVRIPAAYCGTVGLKASYGLVSTRGVVPLSWRLDHVGPLTRSVRDAALLLEAMAGHDEADPLSRPVPSAYRWPPDFSRSVSGLRLARLANYTAVDCEPAVLAAFERACHLYRGLGCEIVDIEVPGYDPAAGRRAGFLLSEVDGAMEFESELDRPGYFSRETHALLTFGRHCPSAKLARAERLLGRIAGAARCVFDRADAVIAPTVAHAAFRFDAPVPANQGDLTGLANFADWPALTLPMGTDGDGMPLGLQVMTPTWQEALALEIGAAYDAAAS
jgi:aspartyl-tRNA(Asn)/glutamyl-tRNA(Gln) amidotransferase subunit A